MSTREELLAYVGQTCPRGTSALEQHEYAVRILCAKLDAQAEEIAVLRKAAEDCVRDRIGNIPPRLAARLAALEKIAHVPYDFTALVKRLEKLERLHEGPEVRLPERE